MGSRAAKAWIAAVVVAAVGTSCISSGVDSYEEFRGAIDGGAPCAELFDIKAGFDEQRDLERIESDLEEIGCDSRDSARNDG